MDKTNRPALFVVDGNEIVIPEPNEEQLLALAAERVSGNVSPQEFLDYPDVRDATIAFFKKQELAKAKAMLAAEKAAKKQVLESARQKLMAELAQDVAGSVSIAPAVMEATETVVISDKIAIAKPTTSPIPATQEPAKAATRPPMPELKQGEVLSDHRALGIVNVKKDHQNGISYTRFAKPEDLLQYKDSVTGNWWCMVTGRLVPEDLIRVVGAVLVCEKSHAERLAKKLVDPRGKEEQHPHFIRGTLDWLKNMAKTMSKPTQPAAQKSSAPVAPKKSSERLAEEENIRAAVGEINSVEKLVSDGLLLLHLHQSDCWQFRFTQAMLSNIAGDLIKEWEAELVERFPSRGFLDKLKQELDSVRKRVWVADRGSFEGFLFSKLAKVLNLHREALQRPVSAPGSVSRKHRPDKAEKLVKEAKSRGIDTTDKSEAELRVAIATREKAKAGRKGSKPAYGRRS